MRAFINISQQHYLILPKIKKESVYCRKNFVSYLCLLYIVTFYKPLLLT